MKIPDLFRDKTIQALKHVGSPKQPTEYYDVEGLGVSVRPSGTKAFIYKFEMDGKKWFMSFGKYPTIKLHEARELYREAKKKKEQGINPALEKKTKKVDRKKALTINEVVKVYIEKRCLQTEQNKGLRDNGTEYLRLLSKDFLPLYGEYKADDVTEDNIFHCIDRVAERSPSVASHLLKVLSAMFEWAIFKKRIMKWKLNPASKIPDPWNAQPRTNKLEEEQLKILVDKLFNPDNESSLYGTDPVKRAIKMILLTGARAKEVSGMHSREIGKDRWWTVPGERTKNEQPHRIYLTDLMLSVIGDREGYIFTSKNGRPIWRETIANVIRTNLVGSWKMKKRYANGGPAPLNKIGTKAFIPHDFRRTIFTLMGMLGIPENIKSRMVGHSALSPGETRTGRKHYNEYEYADEQKAAWEKWNDYICTLIAAPAPIDKTPAKIIPIKKAA